MIALLLEALLALAILLFIVWWTMFSGRTRGEVSAPSLLPTAEPSESNEHKEPNDVKVLPPAKE
jgi:hypothetical protein